MRRLEKDRSLILRGSMKIESTGGYQKYKATCERLFGKSSYRNMSDLESLTLEQLTDRLEVAQGWIERQSNKAEEERSPNYAFQKQRYERIKELIESKQAEDAFL